MGEKKTDHEEAVRRMRARLGPILEPRMRVALVREWLIDTPPEEACQRLILIVGAKLPPGPVQDPLRETVIDLLSRSEMESAAGAVEPLPYEFRADIYAAASRHGADFLTRMLRHATALETLDDPIRQLPREFAEIPLGRRRSLAKGEDKNLLDGLVRDPDTTVINNLLNNPRLREPDVVRIAALRPVAASTLRAVSRSERWSHLPRVRAALARNPYCPPDTAIRMMGALPLQELRKMSRDPDLHPETLGQVHAELGRRESPNRSGD